MTHDTRTSDDIERDIRAERARMSSTMDDLQQKFSVEAILGDLGGMLRNQGGDLGRAVTDTVGRNPAAVVLVGVGLAWLFIGQGRGRAADGGYEPWEARAGRGARPGGIDRDRYWYGNDHMALNNRIHREAEARAQARPADNGGAMGAVQDAAGDVAQRLSHGLEGLSDAARVRVMQARQAAHDARQAATGGLNRGAATAAGFFQDQPLVAGALAVAAGAALGAMLPHSQIEDDTMGDSSDALFARAQALFREERAHAMAAVKGAAADVTTEIRDIGADLAGLVPEGTTAGQVIVDRASDAAGRVLDHATDAFAPGAPGRPRV